MRKRTISVLIVSLALLVPTVALAQWSNDPLVNLAVAAKTDEQPQPKVGALPDGSAYVSWFDNDPTGSPPGGYDVFLQYFDGKGFAQWDPNGLRIADRGLGWTTDYGFAVDASWNALLAFNDDRSGVEQITVTKVSPAGTQLWGPTGVQVSSGTTEKFAPDVAVTSDGNIAVGWAGANRKGPVVFVTKLDPYGEKIWSATVNSVKGFSYDFSRIAAGDNGSVIVLWVRTDTRPFFGTRGLMAQKFSAKGRPQWGKGVILLEFASLQGGEFPKILSDGAGGAVIGWYTADPLECWVQHLNAGGVELFPHNGLAAATNLNDRAEPSFTLDPATGDTIMVYNERGADGYGVGGQRFSPTGVRLWGDDGVAIRPFDWSVQTMWPTVVNTPTGALVTWIEQVAYPDSQIYGAKVDATGNLTCEGIEVSLAPGSKNRIAGVSTPEGGGIFAWEDGRNDFNDIFAQRLGPDCNLGFAP